MIKIIHPIGIQIINIIGNRFQLAAEQIAHKNKINNHNFISSDKKSTMNHHTFNVILAAHKNNNHTINRNILYRQNIKMLYSLYINIRYEKIKHFVIVLGK
jgi:hypothetical protein